MKYVYIVFMKTFYMDLGHKEIMFSDCFANQKVFSSFSRAKTSLLRTAQFYSQHGWAGDWQEIAIEDLKLRGVVFAQQASRTLSDGRYVLYILKEKVNYFS